jgi:hypothetical protein
MSIVSFPIEKPAAYIAGSIAGMIAPKKYSAAAGHADAFKASRPLGLAAGF